jgi:hypothetical protein
LAAQGLAVDDKSRRVLAVAVGAAVQRARRRRRIYSIMSFIRSARYSRTRCS